MFSYAPLYSGDNIPNILNSFNVKHYNTTVSQVNQKLNKMYKIIFYTTTTTTTNKVIKEVMFSIKLKKNTFPSPETQEH